MGCCIVNELQKLGANVNLIIGPSSEKVDENMTVNRVISSKEMYDLSLKKFKNQDIVIFRRCFRLYTTKKL